MVRVDKFMLKATQRGQDLLLGLGTMSPCSLCISVYVGCGPPTFCAVW